MTDAAWCVCANPETMLNALSKAGRLTHRKLRLFNCACVRRIWDILTDERSRNAVEVAERFADGLADEREVEAASQAAWRAADDIEQSRNDTVTKRFKIATKAAQFACSVWRLDTDVAIAIVAACSLISRHPDSGLGGRDNEKAVACSTVRELFGHSLTPVIPQQSWLTSTVLLLAQGIYDEKAFDRLPILADCLMDEGCNSEEILNHLRGPGPHSKGCWAIDMVLGKT